VLLVNALLKFLISFFHLGCQLNRLLERVGEVGYQRQRQKLPRLPGIVELQLPRATFYVVYCEASRNDGSVFLESFSTLAI
jgi:hypothetical protein